MGYEIRMFVGRQGSPSAELEVDKTRPYEDGSGFEFKKDERGNTVKTGRTEIWFDRYAILDLCKLGYQEDPLNALIASTFEKGKANEATVYFFYEGNEQVKDDYYGSKMWPVPLSEVLQALNEMPAEAMEYRRLKWAKALLEAMASDPEGLYVMFFGH